MEIVIHYNVERGFEEAALALARRLFAELDEAIASLALIPVADEDLAVSLNGRLIHSASRSGGLPRVGDLLAACSRTSELREAPPGDVRPDAPPRHP
jgi:hypothetical protein